MIFMQIEVSCFKKRESEETITAKKINLKESLKKIQCKPKRYHLQNNKLSPDIYFFHSIPCKVPQKLPLWNFLRLTTLRGTETTFFTPERDVKHLHLPTLTPKARVPCLWIENFDLTPAHAYGPNSHV